MSDPAPPSPPEVIIAGYGLPGRFVAELLEFRNIPYCVIETNEDVAARCSNAGTPIIFGNVREEQTLRRAGILQAKFLVISVPDEQATFEAIEIAKRLNPAIRITVRSAYTSGGLHAQQLGADQVVVAEQVVAREFFRVVETQLPRA